MVITSSPTEVTLTYRQNIKHIVIHAIILSELFWLHCLHSICIAVAIPSNDMLIKSSFLLRLDLQ